MHYIAFYNQKRPHQTLKYWTPDEVYIDNIKGIMEQSSPDLMAYTTKGGELSQIRPVFLS